jgi:adenylosuccinate synthase
LSALVITKLDILDHLAEIPVGVEYEYRGAAISEFPAAVEAVAELKVRYRVLPGWQQSTFGLRDYAQLPARAQEYLRFLSDQVGVAIAVVSTGPQRDQTIWLKEQWPVIGG